MQLTGGFTIGTGWYLNDSSTTITPVNTVAPVVSGTATVGELLSTTDGTWTGTATITFTYQWQRNGSNIGSATANTYTLVAADAGNPIRCVVTGTNGDGNSSANSNATANVTAIAPGAPTIGTATATGSTTATVAFTAPASNGGSTILSYTATSTPGSITGTLTQAGSGTINMTGLSASTSYTFTVTATNAIGTGAASAASNSITTSAPPLTVDYLLAAGGGGGGQIIGGGGGAGGYLTGALASPVVSTAYTVTVGAGGPAGFGTVGGNGSASQFTDTPTYAGSFGSNSYIRTPTSLVYGTGDFTQEMWIYPTAGNWTSGNFYIFDLGVDNPMQYLSNRFIYKDSYLGIGSPMYTDGPNIPANTWTHIAISRQSGVSRMFVGGRLLITATDLQDYGTVAATIGVGGNGTLGYTGYISNVRIILGTAIYTASFVPSTSPLTAISGTALLTCQNATFIDNSTNNYNLTQSGSPTTLAITNLYGIVATGGGGGGVWAGGNGVTGGSGGGGAGADGSGGKGGIGVPYGQGNAGGVGNSGRRGGGGGGAGAAGTAALTTAGGSGGVGLSSSITGTSTYYAGGGGGSNGDASVAASGGLGGGGNGGGGSSPAGFSGTINTGGGGGGGGNPSLAGSGGSGVAIIKIPDTYVGTVSAGLTSTTSTAVVGYNIYIITAGTGTITLG